MSGPSVAIVRGALSSSDDPHRDLLVIRPNNGDLGWVIHLGAEQDVDAEAHRMAAVLDLPVVEEDGRG